MCEIVVSETLNGPWATPNRVVNHCPRVSKWWIQAPSLNGANLTVCTQHLPGELDRFNAEASEANAWALGQKPIVVKRRYAHPDNDKWSVWR